MSSQEQMEGRHVRSTGPNPSGGRLLKASLPIQRFKSSSEFPLSKPNIHGTRLAPSPAGFLFGDRNLIPYKTSKSSQAHSSPPIDRCRSR
jgi:hypothetical protein